MQTKNVNLPITVTGRHIEITESIRDYALKKVEGLHLDYPRIIEAKVILDVQKNRQIAEVILFCANHITIEATTETEDLYASIDETMAKIARRMRKHKTRLLKNRPRTGSIRHLEEHVYDENVVETDIEEIEPVIIHRENFKVKPLFPDEAIMELELSDLNFVLFLNQNIQKKSLLFRRKDGDYGMVVVDDI
ncbi:MAG: ribosome-associated translation inhibitor RaiA [Verrucomicrobia bacterium]|nr:ribosome-associated translation inhibitor RaiA [Verrucomicrobiota bacterium]